MTRKRERTRLAKAELWMLLASTAERWANDLAGNGPVRPFEEWGDDDPMVAVARRYQLTPADLARLMGSIADQVETRALKAGFEEHWD